MRKWTYLVAALLMSGTAATFTSCIDTEEPAGIADLRGAKAALLRAKAEVELAEVEKVKADASYKAAIAAIWQERAKQEALVTAYKEAENELKKDSIRQKLELSAAESRREIAIALAAAEQAEMQYQQTLIDIELALLGYKENMYAKELQEFLSEEDFSYTTQKLEFKIKDGYEGTLEYDYDNHGNIKYEIKEGTVWVKGYFSLLNQLSTAQHELAVLNQELINLGLRVDYKDLVKENQAKIDYYQGLIDADKILVDEYKKIGDLDIAAWEAGYEDLKTKIETAEEAQTAIDDKLANDLLPYQEKQREIDAKETTDKEYTFTFDKAISKTVIDAIKALVENYNNQTGLDEADKINKDYIEREITNQTVVDEEGNRVFENGFKWTMNLKEFKAFVKDSYTYTPSGSSGSSVTTVNGLLKVIQEKYNMSAQAAENGELELKKLEVNKQDALNAYNAEIEIWKELHDDFIAKAQAYKYNYKAEAASEKYDSRNEIIKKLDEYNALTTEEQTDAKVKEYAEYFAKYLKERYDLDGWNPEYNNADPDNIIYYKDELANTDAAKQKAAFLAFIAIPDSDSDSDSNNYNELFGTAVLNATTDDESLYAKLIASAKKIWGEKYYSYNSSNPTHLSEYSFTDADLAVKVEFDMDEWLAQDEAAITFLTKLYNDASHTTSSDDFDATILGDGLANDRFTSEYLYDQCEDNIKNYTNYGNFLAQLETMVDAYDAEMEAINQEKAVNENAMADLASEAAQTKAQYVAEIEGYNDLMEIMAAVIKREADYTPGTGVTKNEDVINNAIVKIKNAIVNIEGGVEFKYDDGVIAQISPEDNDYEYKYGTLVENQAWIDYYENINKGLADGTYTVEGMYEGDKKTKETAIKIKQSEVDMLDAMCKQASDRKDELLKVITGSTATE